jgi:hypothetical protein
MAQTRPNSVLVIAIFHFIIGGYGVVQNLCTSVFLLAGGMDLMSRIGGPQMEKQMKDMQNLMEQKLPFYTLYMFSSLLFGWVFSIMMLVAGVGLLRMRSWGHKLSLAYASISILHKVFVAVYTFLFLLALYDDFPQIMGGAGNQQAAQAMQKMMATMQKSIAGAAPFISMIYPAVVLFIMLRPSVRAAFRGDTVTATTSGLSASGHIEEDDRWGKS